MGWGEGMVWVCFEEDVRGLLFGAGAGVVGMGVLSSSLFSLEGVGILLRIDGYLGLGLGYGDGGLV